MQFLEMQGLAKIKISGFMQPKRKILNPKAIFLEDQANLYTLQIWVRHTMMLVKSEYIFGT